jgi:putative SOS response-associated peptidase YedK
MKNFHRVRSEKRMVVVIPDPQVYDWLQASPDESTAFLQQYPAERLVAEPAKRI